MSSDDRVKRTGDRRQRRDPVLKLITALGAATALLVVTALILLAKAKPYAFSNVNKDVFTVPAFWNPVYTRALFFLMIAGAGIGVLGLALNLLRLKRRSDSIRLNLVFLTVFSVLGMAAYLHYF